MVKTKQISLFFPSDAGAQANPNDERKSKINAANKISYSFSLPFIVLVIWGQ